MDNMKDMFKPRTAKQLLKTLRWEADMKVVNDFGEHVWLKPHYLNGKRIGITDCCFVDSPCERHRALNKQQAEQN